MVYGINNYFTFLQDFRATSFQTFFFTADKLYFKVLYYSYFLNPVFLTFYINLMLFLQFYTMFK